MDNKNCVVHYVRAMQRLNLFGWKRESLQRNKDSFYKPKYIYGLITFMVSTIDGQRLSNGLPSSYLHASTCPEMPRVTQIFCCINGMLRVIGDRNHLIYPSHTESNLSRQMPPLIAPVLYLTVYLISLSSSFILSHFHTTLSSFRSFLFLELPNLCLCLMSTSPYPPFPSHTLPNLNTFLI